MKQLLALFTALAVILLPMPALAECPEGGNATKSDLDLSSTARDTTYCQSDPVAIQLGDVTRTVMQHDLLTHAEWVAVRQVLSGGGQTIVLSQDGAAVGGSVNLASKLSVNAGSVLIPTGVTAVHDFGVNTLNLAGNLTNSGTIYAVSTDPSIATAYISAQNIINSPGALLTSILPSGGLPGVTGAVPALNLHLTAANDIINHGVISSSAALTAVAGGSIINALPQGVTGAQPVMEAVNNLNLFSNAGNIVNAGLLSSVHNDINIASITATDILINNAGGVLQALNGNINIRDELFTGKYHFDLLGGDIFSKDLWIWSGNGSVNIAVEEITSRINITAHEAAISASTSALIMGNIVFTGDPLIVNDNGDVIIAPDSGVAFSTGGADLTVIASGNIISTAEIISTGSPTAAGNIVMQAGGFIDLSAVLLLYSATDSGSGGFIDLTAGGGSIVINPEGQVISGNFISMTSAQDILAGTLSTPSSVSLEAAGNVSTADIITSTSGSSTPENSIFISSSQAGISTGNLSTPGSAVFLQALSDISTGSITTFLDGTIATGAAILIDTQSKISTDALSTSGASIFLRAGSNISTGSISTATSEQAGAVDIQANHGSTGGTATFFIGDGGDGRFENGVNGTINASSGTNLGQPAFVHISNGGSGGITLLDGLAINVLGSNGPSGDVALNAGQGEITISGSPLTVAGQNGNAAGFVFLNGSRIHLNDTSIIADSPFNYAGGIVFATSELNYQGTAGLSADGFFGHIRGSSAGSLEISTSWSLTEQALHVRGGAADSELNLTGSGTLDVSANGYGGAVQLFSGPLSFSGGDVTLSASGLNGFDGGLVEIQSTSVSNSTTSLSVKADGDGSGWGGVVFVIGSGATADIELGANTSLSARGGAENGSGGIVGILAGGNLLVDTQAIDVSPQGAHGHGGEINLIAGFSGEGSLIFLNSEASLSADGVGMGSGGQIHIASLGAGSVVTIGSADGAVLLSANGGQEAGHGGVITVGSGGDLLVQSTMSASALGAAGAGGFIFLQSGMSGAGNLTVDGSIHADGQGNHNGGDVYLFSYGGSVAIGNSSGGASVTTTGGSAGSLAGDGGNIYVESAGDINIGPGVMSVSASGDGGSAGSLWLIAGTGGDGLIDVSGTLLANGGAVSGSGGEILISQRSSATINVSGEIQADAPGTGNSGHITFENLGSAPLAVNISGSVSATTGDGTAASTEFRVSHATQDVIVDVTSTGQLVGPVIAQDAQSVKIKVDNPDQELTVKNVTTTTGDITIELAGDNSKLSLSEQSARLDSGNNATLTAGFLENNGEIKAAGDLTITASQSLHQDDAGAAISAGGDIKITTAHLFNNGKITGTNSGTEISIASPGTLVIDGSGTIGFEELLIAENQIFINSAAGLTLTGSLNYLDFSNIELSVPGVSFTATAGDIEVITTLNAARSISLETKAGNILIHDGLATGFTGDGAQIKLTAAGGGILQHGGVISTDQLVMTASGGDIGSEESPINASVNKLETMNQSTTNVYVKNDRDLHILGMVGADLSLTVAGSIDVDSFGSFNNLTLVSTGENATIALGTGFALTSATLTTTGAGGTVLLGKNDVDPTDVIDVNTLTVTTNNVEIIRDVIVDQFGTLGASFSAQEGDLTFSRTGGGPVARIFVGRDAPLTISAPNGSVIFTADQKFETLGGTTITAGNTVDFRANVTHERSGDLNAQAGTISLQADFTVSSERSINLLAASGLSVAGNVKTTGGSISLVTGGGALTISEGATVAAQQGNVLLQNSDTAGGMIVIGNNAVISAQGSDSSTGRIAIVIGAVPDNPVEGTAPEHLEVNLLNGGKIYFGENSILVDAGGATATSDASSIIFDTGSQAADAISLGAGVVVSAQSTGSSDPGNGGGDPGNGGGDPGNGGGDPGNGGGDPGNGGGDPGNGGGDPGNGGGDPGNGGGDPGNGGGDPGNGGDPPGSAPSNPSNGGTPPGLDGAVPPGLGGTPPGLGGTPPGLGDTAPPGLGGTPPGQGGTPPGQTKKNNTPPGHAKKAAYLDDEQEGSEYRPVSFMHRAWTTAAPDAGIETLNLKSGTIKCRPSTRLFMTDSGKLSLHRGDLIIATSERQSVKCANVSIDISPNTVALITRDDDKLVVRVLHDRRANSIAVRAGDKQLATLSAGYELALGTGDVLADKVARRSVREHRLGTGYTLSTAEFSIMSAIERNTLLSQLVKSDARDDCALKSRLLKTAYCLMMVTSGRGAYSAKR